MCSKPQYNRVACGQVSLNIPNGPRDSGGTPYYICTIQEIQGARSNGANYFIIAHQCPEEITRAFHYLLLQGNDYACIVHVPLAGVAFMPQPFEHTSCLRKHPEARNY